MKSQVIYYTTTQRDPVQGEVPISPLFCKLGVLIPNLSGTLRPFEVFMPIAPTPWFRVHWEIDRDGEPINVRCLLLKDG